MFRRSFLKAAAIASCVQPRDANATAHLLVSNNVQVKDIPCPDEFAIQPDFEYFNTGGLGPTLKSATAKQLAVIEQLQPRVDRGHQLIEKARLELAQFFGCSETEIAFTRNATEGNSTIACGLELQQGDEIIIDSHAHQGGSVAWMTRQLHEKVVVKAFEPSSNTVQENLDRISRLITPKTKVISVSHVTAPTGIRLPVSEIAQLASDKDIWFHIDGAQSAGMFSIDLKGIACDSFAGCGHKWLCGPIGTGFLYVKNERIDEVQPTDVGDYAAQEWQVPSSLSIRSSSIRFESGTRDPASILGLLEAVSFQQRTGLNKIESHALALAKHLREFLLELPGVEVVSPINDELASGMISFRIEGLDHVTTFGKLWKQRFRCRPVSEQGINAVRISTHFFNTLEQCDLLLEKIRQISDSQK